MKRFYLYYLNLRVWLAHRHWRKLGSRTMLDEADARTLLQLAQDDVDRRKLVPEWINTGLTIIAILSLWIIFFLLWEKLNELRPSHAQPIHQREAA